MKEEAVKVYFASDIHLGAPDRASSLQREKKFVRWLNTIQQDATAIYLVGDLFDFWFEYKTVVPRGYTRLFGKLAEITDAGIPVYFFTGNHDLWMFGYFEEELGIEVYHQPIKRTIGGKTFFIGHGDGLGPGDKKYKFLKKVFTNRLCQWLFGWIHPNIAIAVAYYFSGKSRFENEKKADEHQFLGEDREWLVLYAKRKHTQQPDIEYFIFGHRHVPIQLSLNDHCVYTNLGDWIKNCSYATFNGKTLELQYFEND